MSSSSAVPLPELPVLIVDCQATAAAPRGHLLEIGWARVDAAMREPHACLVLVPDGERVPPAVTRVTGITDRMTRAGVEPGVAWRALSADAATLAPQPAPTVIHFARFEQPFLHRLAGGVPSLDIACTHAIASRLLPELPRRSLRALAGYFGRSVGPLRRSAEHVEATAFVWRALVPLLAARGIGTWSELKAWLASPAASIGRRVRVWPMPREVRLAVPDAPGLYRMLRSSGDVLYVGKAASLHRRVNSYFRHRRGIPERMLEMLSQARDISFDVAPTALEAALLEPDEIKRCQPPYNIALTGERRLWFASRDLIAFSPRPSQACPVGPLPSADTLEEFAALAAGSRRALGRDRWAPNAKTFDEGYARFVAAHSELSSDRGAMPARLLRLGARLWREGRRDRDAAADEFSLTDRRVAAWTPESVQGALEWVAVCAALARRRARWFTRLADATVAWCEPGHLQSRLLVVENGEVTVLDGLDPDAPPPVPRGHRRSIAARHDAFTIARFDRLRVLTTELKRLTTAGAPVAVRLGTAPGLDGARLASALGWL